MEQTGRWQTGAAPRRGVAIGLGVLVTFLWATSVVMIRFALTEEDIDPIGFAGVRFMLAGLLLLPLAIGGARRSSIRNGSRGWLVRVGIYGLIVFCLAQLGFYFSAAELPAATIGLFMGLAPVVAAVITLRDRHERASLPQLVGIALLVAGVAAYFGLAIPTDISLVALVTVVSIPLFVGGGARLGRDVAVDSIRFGGPITMTAIAMLVGAGALLALGLVLEGVPAFSARTWLLIVWMAAVNGAFTYSLWAQSQRTLRAVESSVLGDLTVIQIAIVGWIVLDEALDPTQVLGLLVAVAGVVVVQTAPMLRKTAS